MTLHSVVNEQLYPDLTVTLRLLRSGPIMVKWDYVKLPDGWKKPWAVPDEVLTFDKSAATVGMLSDFVTVGINDALLTIKNGNVDVFDLKSIVLRSYFNNIHSNLGNQPSFSHINSIHSLG